MIKLVNVLNDKNESKDSQKFTNIYIHVFETLEKVKSFNISHFCPKFIIEKDEFGEETIVFYE